MYKMTSYRSIVIPVSGQSPDWARSKMGNTLEVPAELLDGLYVALDEARVVRDSPAVLVFGEIAVEGVVGINLVTDEVVHIPIEGSPILNPVNSTLGQFCECVDLVTRKHPFDESLSDEEIADDLRKSLLKIDAATMAFNGFWGEFVDDVTMGNYS